MWVCKGGGGLCGCVRERGIVWVCKGGGDCVGV